VFAILKRCSECIWPLSIDEAFLDVTDSGRNPVETALELIFIFS
jgi:nucleotidyltransferase/DNA polymerase involved in DNA repair